MGNLSVVSDVTTIASNAVSVATQFETQMDTRKLRKAGNKLGYAVVTMARARQLAGQLGLQGKDLERADALMDAFAFDAQQDILDVMK